VGIKGIMVIWTGIYSLVIKKVALEEGVKKER
jgi:hypothetical protein